jgi:cold shock CspA family protein
VNKGHGLTVPQDGGSNVFVRREGIKAGEEKALEDNDGVSYEAFGGTEGPEERNVSRT